MFWHLTSNSWHWKEENFCKLIFEIINSADLPNGCYLYKLLQYLYIYLFLTIAGSFFIPQESLFYCIKKLHSTNIAETLTCLFGKPIRQPLPDVVPPNPTALKTTNRSKGLQDGTLCCGKTVTCCLTTVCNPRTPLYISVALYRNNKYIPKSLGLWDT